MEDTQHLLSDQTATHCKALRCCACTQAQRPFSKCFLLSCARQRNPSMDQGYMYIKRQNYKFHLELWMYVRKESMCRNDLLERKTSGLDVLFTSLITWKCHSEELCVLSLRKVLCSKVICTYQMWEREFPSDPQNPPFTLLFMQAAVRSFFTHSHSIFQSMMNAKQDEGYSLTCQSSEKVKLPLCEFQVQCIHREGETLLCHRHKHGSGCMAEEHG